MKYKIAISGSTKNTVAMAKTIASDSRFEIIFTLSPAPKLIGRKQIVTKNPLHVWSEEKEIKQFDSHSILFIYLWLRLTQIY